ncbi:hypothetical protein PROFUN_14251 [Planoprotostelium fungivorum]|uniref:Fucose-specific lectin n=1 Tax=Planoprotostelium fungivorum TaxID=1890364 RepID=A0A2P6N5Q7_9EUKA|nr:hypothetical protein PROFUN_14251 [Planoprotostelium fungivorum]
MIRFTRLADSFELIRAHLRIPKFMEITNSIQDEPLKASSVRCCLEQGRNDELHIKARSTVHLNSSGRPNQTKTTMMALTSVRALATFVSTLTTAKTIVDSCAHYVYFTDTQGHIIERIWRRSGWICSDLMTLTSGPASISPPESYLHASGNIYVYYISKEDNHIYQLRKTAEGEDRRDSGRAQAGEEIWRIRDLSELAGITHLTPVGSLKGWCDVRSWSDHLCFTASDNHIYHLQKYRSYGSSWQYEDLSKEAFAAPCQLPFTSPSETAREEEEYTSCEEADEKSITIMDDEFFTIEDDHIDRSSELCRFVFRRIKHDGDDPFASPEFLRDVRDITESYYELAKRPKTRNEDMRSHLDRLRNLLKKSGMDQTHLVSDRIYADGNFFYLGQDASIHHLSYGSSVFSSPTKTGQDDSSVVTTNESVSVASRLMSKMTGTKWWGYTNVQQCMSNASVFNKCIPIGTPSYHSTYTAMHLFFVDYPQYHMHHLWWTWGENKWQHEDLTKKGYCSLVNPYAGILSYSSPLNTFVYYVDESTDNRIHELSMTGEGWRDVDITETLVRRQADFRVDDPHRIPPCQKLLSLCPAPISKQIYTVFIYFSAADGQLYSLENSTKMSGVMSPTKGDAEAKEATSSNGWKCLKLSAMKPATGSGMSSRLGDGLSVSTINKGFVDAMTTAVHSYGKATCKAIASWILPSKRVNPLYMQPEPEEKSKEEILAEQLEEENRRLRQAIESRDLLQAKVVEAEQRAERESKMVKEEMETRAEREMERLREELEKKREEEGQEIKLKLDEEYKRKLAEKIAEVQRRTEEGRRQREEELKEMERRVQMTEESRRQREEELKEAQRRVQVVTGGLNWDTYCQVNLKKAEERQKEEEEECVVCFDAPPQVVLPW